MKRSLRDTDENRRDAAPLNHSSNKGSQPTTFAPNIDFRGDMPNTAPCAKITGAIGFHGRETSRLGSQGIRSDRFSGLHTVRAGAAKTCSDKVMRRILRKIAVDDLSNVIAA